MKTQSLLVVSGLVLIAAVAAGTVIGVTLTAEPPLRQPTPHTILCTADDHGKTIAIKTGDTLNLTLQDYGDGGYLWTITSIDASLLQQVDEFNWGSSGMLGDFGKDTWLFTALNTGSTTLSLDCRRSFDQTDICETFQVTLTIE
ncbi:MAG: protease inhibitor I42 family protein [Candidatus Thermoplasmatota archaeon]|nr:protease inhibitor I42 family protein [Candidatus Thermoplasmatota archaeon]